MNPINLWTNWAAVPWPTAGPPGAPPNAGADLGAGAGQISQNANGQTLDLTTGQKNEGELLTWAQIAGLPVPSFIQPRPIAELAQKNGPVPVHGKPALADPATTAAVVIEFSRPLPAAAAPMPSAYPVPAFGPVPSPHFVDVPAPAVMPVPSLHGEDVPAPAILPIPHAGESRPAPRPVPSAVPPVTKPGTPPDASGPVPVSAETVEHPEVMPRPTNGQPPSVTTDEAIKSGLRSNSGPDGIRLGPVPVPTSVVAFGPQLAADAPMPKLQPTFLGAPDGVKLEQPQPHADAPMPKLQPTSLGAPDGVKLEQPQPHADAPMPKLQPTSLGAPDGVKLEQPQPVVDRPMEKAKPEANGRPDGIKIESPKPYMAATAAKLNTVALGGSDGIRLKDPEPFMLPDDLTETHDRELGKPEPVSRPEARLTPTSGREVPIGRTDGKSDDRLLEKHQRTHVFRQVAEQIENLIVSRRAGDVTLRLDPADLGSITLTVKSAGGSVEASIMASQDNVRQALLNHQSELARQVNDRGLTLSSFDVRPDANTRQDHGQFAANQQSATQAMNLAVVNGVEVTREAQPTYVVQGEIDLSV